MDHRTKSQLVRRISSGRLKSTIELAGSPIDVSFIDPTSDILYDAGVVYDRVLADMKEGGCISLEDSYEILIEREVWTVEKEKQIKDLEIEIDILKERLPSLEFQIQEQKRALESIRIKDEKIDKLKEEKNQLWPSTAEYFAETAKRKHIIQNISKISSSYNVDLNINKTVSNELINCYYGKNAVSEAQIRELARSDPWRVYWRTSKECCMPLFSGVMSNITEYQYDLISWSTIYDFAYNSTNRPSDEVIQNDIKFDVWYKKEADRISRESRSNQDDMKGIKGVGSKEVFIPADAEGARKVYDMNDPGSRQKIRDRQEYVKRRGMVAEQHLPDVKRQLAMEANKMAMEKGRNDK